MKYVLPALPLLLMSSAAYADDAAMLDPVIVSATRLPTPAHQLASSVTLITSEDIAAKQQNTLAEVLRDVPGLNLVQTGNPGSKTTLFMRGTNPNHTKVLIDGMEVSDMTSPDGAFDFSQILAADIDRVEVLRGPQGGLYGSDAIGGVIHVITKKGEGKPKFDGSVEAGSFHTFNQSATVSGAKDTLGYAFSLQRQYSADVPVTPKELVPVGRPRNDDAVDNKTLSAKLDQKISDNAGVGLTVRYLDSVLHTTTDDFTGPEVIRSRSDNNELFTRLAGHADSLGGKLKQSMGVAYSKYIRRFEDPNPGNTDLEHNDGDRVKADWQGSFALTKDHSLTVGAERQLDRVNGASAFEAQMSNTAVFAELQSNINDELYATLSARNDDNSRFGDKATYRIAPAYLIKATGTKLKASYGTGFKAPTLDAMFHNYPAFNFYGNPNLKPEESEGYDVGFEQSLWNKKVQFGSTYFHNSIRNLIQTNATFDSVENIGKAVTYGFESFVSYKPMNTLAFKLDHTYMLAYDEVNHQRLLRRPKHKVSLDADWQVNENLSFNTSLLWVSPWIDANRNFTVSRLSTSSYFTLNFAAEYMLNEHYSFFGRLTNLLNRHYQMPIGFDQQGIGAFAGVRAHY